jgi:hypothetical protein
VAAKATGGIELSWEAEPNSSGGYRAYSVEDKSQSPPCGDNPDARLECESPAMEETRCSDADGLSSEPLLYYQVVGVCGDGSEGAT